MSFYLPNNVWRQVATGVGEVTIKAIGAVRVHFGSVPSGSEGTIYAYKTWCLPPVVDGGGQSMWIKSADVGSAGVDGFRSAVWVMGVGTFDADDQLPARVFNFPAPVGDTFTLAIWGQSEHQHIINQFDDILAPEPLVAQDRVTFWWHDRVTAGAGGVISVTLNDTTVSEGTLTTSAMVAMANVFMREMPGRDINIVMHTVSGTSPREIMDDTFVPSDTPRGWQDDWALHQAVVDAGFEVDYGWHSWFASPGSWGTNYGQNMCAFLLGRDHVTGNQLIYSEGSPLDVNGIQVYRTLADLYGASAPVWVSNSGSHTFIPTGDLLNAVQDAGGGNNASLVNKQASTESWREVIRNPALSAYFTDVETFAIHGYANGFDSGGGVWTDQSHPYGGIDAGINRMSRLIAHSIVRAIGETNYGLPVIDNAFWEPSGTYMEFWSSAGDITTFRGGTGPGSDFPHWTDVLGVEIDGVPAQRAEIQPNGRVRVYPNSGAFTSSSVIMFGRGGSSGWIQHDEDAVAGLWDDYPIVDVGLSDIAGVPLIPLPDASVLASTIIGAPTFQTSDAGPYFRDSALTGVGRTKVFAVFEGTMDADQADNRAYLVGATAGTFQMQAILSNGVVRVGYFPAGGVTTTFNTGTGLVSTGIEFKLAFSLDFDAGFIRAWLNDVLIIDEVIPTGDQLLTNRNVVFLNSSTGNNQFKGTVKRAAVWFDSSTDGTEPSGPPYKEIQGSAATVNADPWKLGADAT